MAIGNVLGNVDMDVHPMPDVIVEFLRVADERAELERIIDVAE